MCEHMLRWAVDATILAHRPTVGSVDARNTDPSITEQNITDPSISDAPGTDMLELYCGNGNFTVALGRNFEVGPSVYVPACVCVYERVCGGRLGGGG
jgi:tRNA/tmRNA/rRNA uracil-C5-methylase (TrmA/RlmC/RlmD family)